MQGQAAMTEIGSKDSTTVIPRECLDCCFGFDSLESSKKHFFEIHDRVYEPQQNQGPAPTVLQALEDQGANPKCYGKGCDLFFPTILEARAHLASSHGYCPQVTVFCGVCGLIFKRTTDLKRHQLFSHDSSRHMKGGHGQEEFDAHQTEAQFVNVKSPREEPLRSESESGDDEPSASTESGTGGWSYPNLRYDCSCPEAKCRYEDVLCTQELIREGIKRNRRSCFMFGCGSRYPKHRAQGRDAVLFHLPLNASAQTRQAWTQNIPCRFYPFDFLQHYICHLHFDEEFIIGNRTLPILEWKLKTDGVPTLFDMSIMNRSLDKKKRKMGVRKEAAARKQIRREAKKAGLPDPFAGTQYASQS